MKKKWFQIVWVGLLLVSLALNYLQRWVDAAWAQNHALTVFSDVLGWIVLALTVVLFVLHCVENWRTGKRYFWRKCRRWGGNIFLGTLMAVAVLLVIRFVKSGGALENVLPERWFNIFMFVVLSVGGLLYMIARYKFNNSNKD